MLQEKRTRTATVNIRSDDGNDLPVLEGYALKFNRDSEELGYWSTFIERLDSKCLDDTDMTNVVALVNHDSNLPLARTGINLDLVVDNIGLKFVFTPTDTSYARDLIANIKAGVINKCSFAFTIADEDDAEKWEKTDDNIYIRTIYKIDKLYDVSIVTTPAYSDTEVVVGERSREKIECLLHDKEKEEREKLSLIVKQYGI